LTDEIKQDIKTVALACQKGIMTSVFNGVKIGTEIVATDSKRVYVSEGFTEEEVIKDGDIQEWVIPSLAIPFIEQFEELVINRQNAIFSNESWELRTHLLTSKFPNHNKVFPKDLHSWFKITDEVVNGVKLAGGYIPKDSFKIILETRGSVLVIETGDDEAAFTTEVEIEGYADKRMAFNQKFFLELCEVFNGETLKAGDLRNPITVNKNNLRGLLMPLRVTR
jgi:DNA polymerase III sliding clamp (beta) subunit (PCNA family)